MSGDICPMTGKPHVTYYFRGAVWCQSCRQKLEACCEGAPGS